MEQPSLFPDAPDATVDDADIVLLALADFQARGLTLAARELPLDRLRGALRRATEAFEVAEISDERAAAAFRALGAQVRQVPKFVAKHPFRVTVPAALAERARGVAAHFLIRVQLQHDAARDGNTGVAEGAHGKHEEGEAGFHVEHAGSPEAALLLAPRHFAKRAQRPHGVAVAERENLSGLAFGARRQGQFELALQVRTHFAAGGNICDAAGE